MKFITLKAQVDICNITFLIETLLFCFERLRFMLTSSSVPTFNFSVSLSCTASYVIFSLSMVQAMEIFMITQQDVTEPRETEKLKLGSLYKLLFVEVKLACFKRLVLTCENRL